MIQHTYSGDEFSTIVTSKSGKQMMFIGTPVSKYEKGLESYKNGAMIQNAFPFLSANEREFLISGMLPSEFDALFEGIDDDVDEPPPPFGEP